jgi:hypothetical protein
MAEFAANPVPSVEPVLGFYSCPAGRVSKTISGFLPAARKKTVAGQFFETFSFQSCSPKN